MECVKLGLSVKVKQQAKGGPCYTFFKLDRKTYNTKFSLKMLIRKRYNRSRDDVNIVYNEWK
jgi:hypothetical protein